MKQKYPSRDPWGYKDKGNKNQTNKKTEKCRSISRVPGFGSEVLFWWLLCLTGLQVLRGQEGSLPFLSSLLKAQHWWLNRWVRTSVKMPVVSVNVNYRPEISKEDKYLRASCYLWHFPPNFFFEIPKENFKETSRMLLARVPTHDGIPGISAECDVWGAVVTSLGSGVCIPTDALRSPANYSGMCRQLLCSGYKPPFGSDRSVISVVISPLLISIPSWNSY